MTVACFCPNILNAYIATALSYGVVKKRRDTGTDAENNPLTRFTGLRYFEMRSDSKALVLKTVARIEKKLSPQLKGSFLGVIVITRHYKAHISSRVL